MNAFWQAWSSHFGSGILARPLLALLFSSAYIYMTLKGIDPGDAYVAITTAVVLYFFRSQDEARNQSQLKAREDELIELAKQLPPPEA